MTSIDPVLTWSGGFASAQSANVGESHGNPLMRRFPHEQRSDVFRTGTEDIGDEKAQTVALIVLLIQKVAYQREVKQKVYFV
jgi:hypothetical protein